jgi:hypothetical protein
MVLGRNLAVICSSASKETYYHEKASLLRVWLGNMASSKFVGSTCSVYIIRMVSPGVHTNRVTVSNYNVAQAKWELRAAGINTFILQDLHLSQAPRRRVCATSARFLGL